MEKLLWWIKLMLRLLDQFRNFDLAKFKKLFLTIYLSVNADLLKKVLNQFYSKLVLLLVSTDIYSIMYSIVNQKHEISISINFYSNHCNQMYFLRYWGKTSWS